MTRLIIEFDIDKHNQRPWPILVDGEDTVISGLGPDDGSRLLGFGPFGAQRVDIFPEIVRQEPAAAKGLVATFSNGTPFEWQVTVREVRVIA